jgi:hypothetical protein
MDEKLQELELQQEVERFSTQFSERITQATESLEGSSLSAEVRDEALRKNLRYVSAAMEIATGPYSEVNLLDMIVFVRLCRSALDRHWIPELYGERGRELTEVFDRSEEELSVLAARALTPEQRREADQVVESWLNDNPDQRRVEGIRLAGLASAAGAAATERSSRTRGLLASVKGASRVANQALLLSERALFLFHRLPFVWRLQARVGAREMTGDFITRMTDGPSAPLVQVRQRARYVARRGLAATALLGGLGLLGLWVGSLVRQRRLAY